MYACIVATTRTQERRSNSNSRTQETNKQKKPKKLKAKKDLSFSTLSDRAFFLEFNCKEGKKM
jgi:hypothetical protein